MKKILLGMACMALMASCSKVNISEEDDHVTSGLYKIVATYNSSTAETKFPVSIGLSIGSDGNLYTYNVDGSVKKVDGKVYLLNSSASVRDTTVTVFTDKKSSLTLAFTAVSIEDGNKLSYDISISRDGKEIERFKEQDLVLNAENDKSIIY